MKAVIDGKLYDTEKAEVIYSYRRKVDNGPVFWHNTLRHMPMRVLDIYKTPKGAYFEYDKEGKKIYIIDEERVREIMMYLDPDKYMEFFNVTLEEA